MRRSQRIVLVALLVVGIASVVVWQALPHTSAWDWIAYRDSTTRPTFPEEWQLDVRSLERRDWIRSGPERVHRVRDHRGKLLVVSHSTAVPWLQSEQAVFIDDHVHGSVFLRLDASGRVVGPPVGGSPMTRTPDMHTTLQSLVGNVELSSDPRALGDALAPLAAQLDGRLILDAVPAAVLAAEVRPSGATLASALRQTLGDRGLAYGIDTRGRVHVYEDTAAATLDVRAVEASLKLLDLPITVEFDGVALERAVEFLGLATGGQFVYLEHHLLGQQTRPTKCRDTPLGLLIARLLQPHDLVRWWYGRMGSSRWRRPGPATRPANGANRPGRCPGSWLRVTTRAR